MRLPSLTPALLTVAASLISSTAALAAAAQPLDFRDIEYRYQGDDATARGKSEVVDAIAVGSAVADGVRLLRAAGAHCRPLHADPDAMRCLYNQMSSDGDAVDEVRWTTVLHSRDGRVTDVSIRRDVDVRVMN